tara:strand:- start:845 stop:1579 length:735 start_codon:yes stop_codon:yes gene_type:complete
MKNIISFSLWSQDKQLNPKHINQHKDVYTQGAIMNTLLAKEFYPGWICRFYVDDSVPNNIIEELKNNDAEIINMTGSLIPGMYWRFLVVDDKDVAISIIRDTDSRLNSRDRLVVDKFIESDKILHIVRDHPHHNYPILGGMWGIKSYKIDIEIEKSILQFLKQINRPFKRMDDMIFLDLLTRNLIQYSICHDNYYTSKYKNSVKFPDYCGSNEYYHYIGEYYDQWEKNQYYERDLKLIKEFKFK